MTEVYIIRHAEAEGNFYRRIHGHYDSHLTNLGVKQLDALEKRFAGVRIDKVYSSDLRRTMHTSTAVTRSRGMEAVPVQGLREICMGEWEDREWGYAEKYYTRELINFTADPEKWTIPGAERFLDVQRRMLDTVRRLATENEGKTIALFSHGAAIRAFTAAVMGIRSEDISVLRYCDNTAVMRLFVENGKITLKEQPDASHLTEEYSRLKKQNWHKNKNGLDISNLRMEVTRGADMGFLRQLCGDDLPDLAVRDRENTATVFRGEEPVGAVSVDTRTYAAEDAGALDLYVLDEKWRNMNYSPQLMGRAVSRCRRLGLRQLRAEFPEPAAESLLYMGFQKTGGKDGKILLSMDI